MIPAITPRFECVAARQHSTKRTSLREFWFGSCCSVCVCVYVFLSVCDSVCCAFVYIIWSAWRLSHSLWEVSLNWIKIDSHAFYLENSLPLSLSLSDAHTHTQVKGVSYYVTRAAVEMSGVEGAVIGVEGFYSSAWKEAFVNILAGLLCFLEFV